MSSVVPRDRLGLSQADAARLLALHGPNEVPGEPPDPAWRRALRQLKSPLNYVLLAAIVFELGFWWIGGDEDAPWGALVIGLTLLVNVAFGFVHEARSQAALDRLRALAAPRSWVIRDGALRQVPSRELVPGDVVRIEAGDRVPADGALVAAGSLPFDESLLTGESLPVDRADAERVHAGALLLRGRAHVLVEGTGAKSALGGIATLIAAIELGKTPLERRLDRLGARIAMLVLGIALVVSALGLAMEGVSHAPEVLLFAAALAVAAVPEELPATMALTLALGVERMAKRNALLRRLPAVEALGSVTVLCTDKTGTLTHNRLRVRALAATDEAAALRAMVLANDATPTAGDPLDVALLAHAAAAGVDVEALRRARPRVAERPFDSAWRFMRVTVTTDEGASESHLKGAPEAILARCALAPADRASWEARADAAAREGRRVLALAWGPSDAERDLRFLGLVELSDPPRAQARASVEAAQGAGIRVVLLTGDHPATAASVGAEVGIPAERVVAGDEVERADDRGLADLVRSHDVFARILPHHKLRIVEALQRDGEIVAMIGDGVNDAPALKRADVGIAMGQRGSDVAREAAALVLLDDDLATVVSAIEEGRTIGQNITKFLRFMFSTSLSLVILVLGGAVAGWALGLRTADGALLLPLTAMQILWINFLADGPPSFAIGLDKDPGALARAPRSPQAPLLDRASAWWIGTTAMATALVGMALLFGIPWLGYGALLAQTSVFAYEFIAQVILSHPARTLGERPIANRALRWSMGLVLTAEVALLASPPLRALLGLGALDARLALLVLVAAGVSWLVAMVAGRAFGGRGAPGAREPPRTTSSAKREGAL